MQADKLNWWPNESRLPHMIAVGLVLMISGFWGLTSAGLVHACSCMVPGSPAEELEVSAAVFVGRVVSIEHSFDPSTLPRSADDRTTVGFEVSSVWKGDIDQTTYVTTPPTGGSCGFAFSEGEEYFVYADDSIFEDSGYTVHICSRTILLANAQEDIAALGEGKAPQTGTGEASFELSGDMGLNWPLVAALVFAVPVLAGLLVYWFVVRRRTARE